MNPGVGGGKMEMGWSLLLVCFLVLTQTLVIECCVREEREALLNMKAYFLTYYKNDTLVDKRLSSWVTDPNSDCCTWNRVRCRPSSGRVSILSLQDLNYRPTHEFGLQMPILAEVPIDFSLFQNFKDLTSLNLSQGQFSGTLTNTGVLGNLSNLEVLVLKSNDHEGSLPFQEICKLKKIRVLDFSQNLFEGSLHKCLANLTSLQALDLSSNYLTGEIPASAIASLTSLEYFSPMNNYFKGLFPLSSFTNNTRLKVLALPMSTNDFQVDTESQVVPWVPSFQLEVLHLANCKVNAPSGTFPSILLYQHDLHYLDLSNNDLVGAFPNWLVLNNTNLRSLILHRNKFTGSFELPTYIDQPPHPMINLQLSDNKMEGKLPTNIDLVFPNLEILNVSGNGFDGGISTSIGNMSKLYALDLSRNKFSGEVPESLWAGRASLSYLILSHNNLQGKLFPSHLNSSSLRWLFLDSNCLNGTLEHGTWGLLNLRVLDISDNSFWGMVPSFITNSSFLQVINLSRNNFKGTLPREFCKLDLVHLHLSHNYLSGSIPPCYLNLENLMSLQLQSNSLEGAIPTLRRSVSYLSTLDLRDNNLSGVIPDWIVRVELLRALLLGGNKLHGQIPNQLCQLKKMSFLDLSRNNFTGNIPVCFNKVSFGEWRVRISEYDLFLMSSDSWYQYNPLQMQLFFAQNMYYMTAVASGLEVEFRTKYLLLLYKGDILRFMSGIDLSCNQLTGKVPPEMGYLDSLHALNLSHNHLNGSIPKSFQNLSAIESLDLSYNNLDGEIPIQLQDLNSLGVFNVTYNNLSGRVPSGGHFLTFDWSSFRGNHYLIWDNSNRGTPAHVPPPTTPLNNDAKEDEFVIDFTSFIWSFSACYVTTLIVMVTVLWINPYWRRLWFYFIETCLYRCLYPYLKDAFY